MSAFKACHCFTILILTGLAVHLLLPQLTSFETSFQVLGKGGWKRPVFGAIITAIFDMLTLYFFFIAAGYPVEPEILIIVYVLPLFFGKIAFLLPGGVGVVESTMVALYTGLGVPGSIAVVVTLSYRLFSFWVPTVTGFSLAFYLQKHKILSK